MESVYSCSFNYACINTTFVSIFVWKWCGMSSLYKLSLYIFYNPIQTDFQLSTSIIKFPIFESFIYKTHNLSDNLVQFSYSFKFYFIEIFAGYTCIYLAIVSAWTDISYLFCSYSIGEIGHGFKIYDYFCSLHYVTFFL